MTVILNILSSCLMPVTVFEKVLISLSGFDCRVRDKAVVSVFKLDVGTFKRSCFSCLLVWCIAISLVDSGWKLVGTRGNHRTCSFVKHRLEIISLAVLHLFLVCLFSVHKSQSSFTSELLSQILLWSKVVLAYTNRILLQVILDCIVWGQYRQILADNRAVGQYYLREIQAFFDVSLTQLFILRRL